VPRPTRQRSQPRGRLVSWPLYRILLAVAVFACLAAALFVETPTLPPQPDRELTFDGPAAADQAAAFLSTPRQRGPGEPGDFAAAEMVAHHLEDDGYHVQKQRFAADLPGRGNVALENVIGYSKGTSPEIIAVIAHRDAVGTGADDNASGTGVMLELAQELSKAEGRERGIAFVSTDAGTTGGQGATEFATQWVQAHNVVAAIVLDAIAAPPGSHVQLLIRPNTPRGTSPILYLTTRRALLRFMGPPETPGAFNQITGYAVPYARTEQGPLLAAGMPAVTLTAGPAPDPEAGFGSLHGDQLGPIGTATINLLATLDEAQQIDPGGPPSIFLSGSLVRGRLAQIALVLLLAPFLTATLDAAARCRRRRIPLAGALAAFAWRSSTWFVGLLALWFQALLPRDLVSSVAVAPPPGDSGLSVLGLALAILAAFGWWRLMARPRLLPAAPIGGRERTAGLVGAWLGLGFAGLMLCAINPYALLLILPAAHAWLWLPHVAWRGRGAMLLLVSAGLIGPVLILLQLASGQDLGLGALRTVIAMAASGYISPAVSICLVLACAAGTQVTALVLGHYAPAAGVGVSRRIRLYN